jgi:inner membrane protein
MASIGHIAVGMAAARVYYDGRDPGWRSMASWSALSLLPDADVIGFALGVAYGDPWGHRGATHSLTAAVAGGIAVGVAARAAGRPIARTATIATLVLASHGLLDTLTDGGLGAAMLAPFDLTRYFAPWRPIPVAPIGLDFFSAYGLIVSLTEAVLFAPLLVFALRSHAPRPRTSVAGLALWLTAVWLIASADPVREAIMSRLLHEDTAYASGFSESEFRRISIGQSAGDVRRLLGPPHEEGWFYFDGHAMDTPASAEMHGCRILQFESGALVTARQEEACKARGIEPGLSLDNAARQMGAPAPEACWDYSWSPSHGHHRQRTICVANAKVAIVMGRWQ